MKEESLRAMCRKVSICTSFVNMVTEDGKLFASGLGTIVSPNKNTTHVGLVFRA